ncbi:Hypothetical protein Minf_0913 [Methylacidiphilum infernorum V4]|uniref:Uncharacterized protein n=1 Tax=Methylacidiphilum infernorum (isolate V4) TaxID=481448 RepID=B3DUG5_METI4|nr:Hypothetical protein Minf_0913 [Methylacidiphilum infernorum V4]
MKFFNASLREEREGPGSVSLPFFPENSLEEEPPPLNFVFILGFIYPLALIK